MFRIFRQYLNGLRWPAACLLCGDSADVAHPLCPSCETDLPWLRQGCRICALPLPLAGQICPQCQQHPPPFEQVIAPWAYRFPADRLINRFKHHADLAYGRLLCDMLAVSLQRNYRQGIPRPHCLVPVPLSDKRQRQRGFNQALLLAHWLGRKLDIPLRHDLLRRRHDTPAQQTLNAQQRRRNLHHAFTIDTQASLHSLHVALVDDVVTTGATAEQLATLLCKAGVRRVDVYCLARTPKPA